MARGVGMRQAVVGKRAKVWSSLCPSWLMVEAEKL